MLLFGAAAADVYALFVGHCRCYKAVGTLLLLLFGAAAADVYALFVGQCRCYKAVGTLGQQLKMASGMAEGAQLLEDDLRLCELNGKNDVPCQGGCGIV